jgi:thioredoxin 1
MAGANTLHFDEANFEAEVLNATQPVLVDFWAEWCGPCLMLAPTIDELATEYAGKVKVGKCDVDKAPKLAAQYGVQNIPTVLLFVSGKAAQRVVGAKNKREYKTILDEALGTK